MKAYSSLFKYNESTNPYSILANYYNIPYGNITKIQSALKNDYYNSRMNENKFISYLMYSVENSGYINSISDKNSLYNLLSDLIL